MIRLIFFGAGAAWLGYAAIDVWARPDVPPLVRTVTVTPDLCHAKIRAANGRVLGFYGAWCATADVESILAARARSRQ
jgi:hypothetical protein